MFCLPSSLLPSWWPPLRPAGGSELQGASPITLISLARVCKRPPRRWCWPWRRVSIKLWFRTRWHCSPCSLETCLPVVHVALVAEVYHLLHVGAGVLLNVPWSSSWYCQRTSDGISYTSIMPNGSSVVGRGDGPEPLLAGGVPFIWSLIFLPSSSIVRDFWILCLWWRWGVEGILGTWKRTSSRLHCPR